MAELYLIFQMDNPAGSTRFRAFLSHKGWRRLSTGIYLHLDMRDFDQEAFWTHASEEFSIDPKRDFFAVFRAEWPFVPTGRYYNKKAPPWPHDFPSGKTADE